MKLTCPRCHARYTVAAESVPPGAALRFTCRRCGELIRLRPQDRNVPPAQPAYALGKGSDAYATGLHDAGSSSLPEVEALVGDLGAAGSDAPSPFDDVASPEARAGENAGETGDGAAHESAGNADPSPTITPDAGVQFAGVAVAYAPASDRDRAAFSEAYLRAPPGDAARLAIRPAGLYRLRQRHRMAAMAAVGIGLALAALPALDFTGVLAVPGMEVAYEATGIADPHVERAVARVEARLHSPDLTPPQRESLRLDLAALQARHPGTARRAYGHREAMPPAGKLEQSRSSEPVAAGSATHDLAVSVFGDERKRGATLTLEGAATLSAVSLPSGLTQEAILTVVAENGRAMKLCLEDAVNRGDRPSGKVELKVTIAAEGTVVDAEVSPARLRGTALASCMVRRVKGWHFPRFEGGPVTVIFPYVLSLGV